MAWIKGKIKEHHSSSCSFSLIMVGMIYMDDI